MDSMVDSLAILIFWLLLGGVGYVYLGYPLLLWVLARLFHRPVKRDESYTPTVSVIVAAYNEEQVIREKIEGMLKWDYPHDQLEIMIGSDCSTDRTDEIVREYAPRGVVLYRQPERRGKTALLNAIVPLARGEILVFSDANAFYNADALRMLVRNFADPKVGYVTGEARYSDSRASAVGYSENIYWRYEMALRRGESAIGSMVGADGAIYALRRELYEPLREDDINDFVNPLQVVARGWRGIFEPAAICYESTSGRFESEFRRKVRIINRSWRGLMRVKAALNPFRVGLFAWQMVSHKLLRWLMPFFLMGLALASVGAVWGGGAFYQGVLLAQGALYGLAFLGRWGPSWLRRLSPFYLPYYFCLVNHAALLGVVSAWRGQAISVWQPERSATVEASEVKSAQKV